MAWSICLKRFLEGEGFRVDAAYDHASGLSAARSGEHELIILDVMLTGGTGFELLKALRQQSSVPVLLLPRAAKPSIASWVWRLALTTTWPSPSIRANW